MKAGNIPTRRPPPLENQTKKTVALKPSGPFSPEPNSPNYGLSPGLSSVDTSGNSDVQITGPNVFKRPPVMQMTFADLGLNYSSETNDEPSPSSAYSSSPMAVAGLTEIDEKKQYTLPDRSYTVKPTILGRGAFGFVYAGTNDNTNEPVAVKTISPVGIDFEDACQKIRREFDVQQALFAVMPSGIIEPIDIFIAEGTVAVVMELADGDLADVIKRGGFKSEQAPNFLAIAPLFRQVLTTVMAMGDAGFIHNDIKPANFLMVGGIPKLGDFGCARSVAIMTDPLFEPIGTEANLPNFELRVNTDFYSVGVMFARLLLGKSNSMNIFEVGKLLSEVDLKSKDLPPTDSNRPIWQMVGSLLTSGICSPTEAPIVDATSKNGTVRAAVTDYLAN